MSANCSECGGYIGCQDEGLCDDCGPELRAKLELTRAKLEIAMKALKQEAEDDCRSCASGSYAHEALAAIAAVTVST